MANESTETTKITLDVNTTASDAIAQEAKEKKRTRKAQMELILEEYADGQYVRRGEK